FVWALCNLVYCNWFTCSRHHILNYCSPGSSFVVKGCMGWKGGLNSFKFKSVWAGIILLGVFFSSLRLQPIEVIKFAQVANGILLPVIAIFLLWIVNKRSVLGAYRNTVLQNFLGF